MDPSPPPLPQNPNPNPNPKQVYQISGVPVEFPYKPYGTQLAFMGRVISTLDRAKRQGHCHALLESPTGTGKSLSLLCSALAWQRHHPRRFPQCNPKPNPNSQPSTAPDPLVHGGGFIPEPETSSMNLEQGKAVMSARDQKKMVMPKIYYASRTHSQISQVIREYRKTSYRVPMAVLASRKHYCTNKHVCRTENIDENCKLLLKDEGAGCPEFKNAHKVKSHSSLQKGGTYEVHDIEDLVKIGRTVKGCSYFASQTLAAEAQIVFCPYSYIVNPVVRRAMDIDIKGSIVILDEAHNIEDMARDAGSMDVEEDVLHILQMELGQLCMDESLALIYRPLYDTIQGIIGWIGDRKNNLQKREFEHYSSFWTGDKAINELQLAGITLQCFPVLQECAAKAIKAVSDAESEGAHLSGTSAITLETIFSSLGYFFSGNGCHVLDYQLVLQRHVKRDSSNTASGWTCSLSLWCLNPSVVFRDIAHLCLSVILTSGTLSPMGSFASELGVQFEACMEAPHVIDVESQLWASVITSGPGNCQLNASYKTADGYAFQDSLGASLEEICKIVPGGALVFFPSYKLLEKLRLRWCQTGQWSRLNAQKSVFIEPRGTDEFESALGEYYDCIRGQGRTFRGKTKNGQKRFSTHINPKASSETCTSGAAFLAVCRGKVSEGIDFADENARVVVVVGIPFPNTNDIQVVLKKRYNDTYKPSKSLLSGSDWYCHQAFRALNQAAGRCIRHRSDYGAVILLDERFKEKRNLNYISKWLRNSIKQYDSFDESMAGLRSFFEQKRLIQKGRESELVTSDPDIDNLISSEQNLTEVNTQKKNQKQKKPNGGRRKIIPDDKVGAPKTFPKDGSPSATKSQCLTTSASELNEKVLSQHVFSAPICIASPENTLEQSTVINSTAKGYQASKPDGFSKYDNSFSGLMESCNQLLDRQSFSCCTFSNGMSSEDARTTTISPERVTYLDVSDTEQESTLNKSVNSYSQRKRKLMDARDKNRSQVKSLNYLDSESCYKFDRISAKKITTYASRRIQASFADSCSDGKPQLHGLSMQTNMGMLPILDDTLAEKKLHICCLVCENPLGLLENNFIVPCRSTSLSKVYLAYILDYEPKGYSFLECLSSILKKEINVIISDTSSVDQRMFKTGINENVLQHDIWCEEDGCVFRTTLCPFCTDRSACLGVEIKATDTSNVHLLNKVVFFADHLYIKDEQTPKQEATLRTCVNNLKPDSGSVDIEKYAYNSQHDSVLAKREKSKQLRLPRK
ncbi:Fanconi anemia group J protein homolog isoform X2 [Asparagus officinalis]|uniref:Fanconi anemia group J protein homolog isoform X2 n=1 Tax=Asparagus officinalis TaxID=4686 RepID=UPI00098E6916|nr:Fanconi anemia group J protein homolog isoform X2 [Asparagus officinalis]